MSLSILCVTNNAFPGTERFIVAMRQLADRLQAEFVLGLDRIPESDLRGYADTAIDLQADRLQEDVLDEAVKACGCEWVLRLDDDETVSPALERWLARKGYEKAGGQIYAFPRVYLYPDERHVLTNKGIYPDLQTRLGRKEWMTGYTYIHAGNPHGTGLVAPYALEHHKLLVRDFDERKAIAARYESIRPGAGSLPEYARYNLPELFYERLETKEYKDGDYSA